MPVFTIYVIFQHLLYVCSIHLVSKMENTNFSLDFGFVDAKMIKAEICTVWSTRSPAFVWLPASDLDL